MITLPENLAAQVPLEFFTLIGSFVVLLVAAVLWGYYKRRHACQHGGGGYLQRKSGSCL